MAPLAAASVQHTLPSRQQVFGERGVVTCDVGQLFKPPKALQPNRRQRQAPLAAASAQSTLPRRQQVFGARAVASCDVGKIFKPHKSSSA
jgi:hypothetical protein